MQQHEAIKLFKEYGYTCKRINEINSDIIKYNQLINATRDANMGISYEREKLAPTYAINDSTYNTVEKIIDLYGSRISEWENKLEELFKKKHEAEEILDKLGGKERNIIELKYIKCLRWWQVARVMNYSERQCRRINDEVFGKLK
jgi:DNA-directed RNA polymerase specialized sigma subunit